ncbi:MAG: 50S ribosomal protein L18 [Clostridia bacterium]|nr:50S ribosomal protein L18 [Clostridia bacterium]
MISKIDKNAERVKRHKRIRNRISGTQERPRLCVYRSDKHIYAQVIDDTCGKTLAAASTTEKAIAEAVAQLTKTEASKVVGKAVAEKALAAGITEVVFDRGGYLYTGRVSALADGAREGGLKF